jgi:membrane-associated phospholipid phosphatase
MQETFAKDGDPQEAPPPLAGQVASHVKSGSSTADHLRATLEDLNQLDLAVYRAVAATPTPTLDRAMRRLSRFADHSKPWMIVAAGMGVFGGSRGRRAMLDGLAAVAVSSAFVSLPAKLIARRRRPDRAAAGVPVARQVPMPESWSLPSGHSASGFAFSAAIGARAPALSTALRLLASAIGYSRVHTGGHDPGDVVIGSLIGSTIGESVSLIDRRIARRIGGR